jgi:hypothetical protein
LCPLSQSHDCDAGVKFEHHVITTPHCYPLAAPQSRLNERCALIIVALPVPHDGSSPPHGFPILLDVNALSIALPLLCGYVPRVSILADT